MPRTAFVKRGDQLEEVPVERKLGDEVFAGTINQDNTLVRAKRGIKKARRSHSHLECPAPTRVASDCIIYR